MDNGIRFPAEAKIRVFIVFIGSQPATLVDTDRYQ